MALPRSASTSAGGDGKHASFCAITALLNGEPEPEIVRSTPTISLRINNGGRGLIPATFRLSLRALRSTVASQA